MVIRDLFFSDDAKTPARAQLNVAGVSDRFTAAVFDFFILSPVVSLLLAGLLREIKTYLILDSHSPEASVIWVLFVAAGIFSTILLQSLFLYFWGATPGQRFLLLRVVSFPQEAPLTFSQCLLRSALGLCSFLFLGVPYLEVISHPLRRVFHERASDTIVISLKEKLQYAPLAIEKRFVGLWVRLSFALFIAAGVILAAREYLDAKRGLFARTADAQKLFCSDIAAVEDETSPERLDRALALFLTDEVTADCLEKEADRALWDVTEDNKTWAYLAKGIVGSDSKIQNEYFDKVCQTQDKVEACVIARYLGEDEDEARFEFQAPQSASGKVLVLDQQMADRNFPAAFASIKDLRELDFLNAHLERNFVRAVWSTAGAKSKSRAPASVGSADKGAEVQALKEFKEKYGVE
jgi:uncharacterized RDD family membrane protein YckC